MSRAQVLLVGLALLAAGAGGYALFQAGGLPEVSAGIAASLLLLLVILGWTTTYLVRVLSGRMTFSEQRRRYRAGYEAATDQALEARFAALPPEEQARLLAELGLAEGQPPLQEPATSAPDQAGGPATP